MSKVKLVIEIEHNEYTGIKNFPDGTTSYPWTIHLYDAVRNGTPLDDVKAEFINSYPTNYMGEPELGGASCHFSLNKVLQILDNIGKESEDKCGNNTK